MKITELLAEDISQLNVLIKLLKRDCAPFLREVEAPLYRGIYTRSSSLKKMGPDLFRGTVRKDRRPKDSSEELNANLNMGIERHLGIKNARDTSLFCSFSMSQANSYGTEVFLVFPIGDFQYIWSPFIADAYAALEDNWGDWDDSVAFYVDRVIASLALKNDDDEPMEYWDIHDREMQENIVHHLMFDYADKIYRTNRIKAAYNTSNEIMVQCDHYYAISVGTLYKHYEVSPDELMKALHGAS
jgi:hypothetical protein